MPSVPPSLVDVAPTVVAFWVEGAGRSLVGQWQLQLSGASLTNRISKPSCSRVQTDALSSSSHPQTADLGALLALGSSLTLRIYQKSARLGRGPALTKTLFF